MPVALQTSIPWLLRRDQGRWRKYAENVLWPVFHYIQGQPSDGKAETDAWHDYVKFNEAYLNKIKSVYKPGTLSGYTITTYCCCPNY